MPAKGSGRVERSCQQCGAVFRVYPSDVAAPKRGAKFCSLTCRYLSQRGRPVHAPTPKPVSACAECGTEIAASAWRRQRGEGRYCSRRCQSIARRLDPARVLVEQTCLACGASFEARVYNVRSGEATYCSRACARRHLGNTRRRAWQERFAQNLGERVPPPLDKSHLTHPCQLWTGAHDPAGYAIFWRGRGLSYRAGHAAYLLYTGQVVPPGLVLMHLCNLRGCVEPTHLRPGTHAENMRQMVADGRGRAGGRHRLSGPNGA